MQEKTQKPLVFVSGICFWKDQRAVSAADRQNVAADIAFGVGKGDAKHTHIAGKQHICYKRLISCQFRQCVQFLALVKGFREHNGVERDIRQCFRGAEGYPGHPLRGVGIAEMEIAALQQGIVSEVCGDGGGIFRKGADIGDVHPA